MVQSGKVDQKGKGKAVVVSLEYTNPGFKFPQ